MWMDYLMEAGFHQEACSGTLERLLELMFLMDSWIQTVHTFFVFKMNFKLSCNIMYNKYITNEYNII